MQIKLASRHRCAVESAPAHDVSAQIVLVCRCLRGVDRHYRPRMPTTGAEKAFTVSHILAQLFWKQRRTGGDSDFLPTAKVG